MNLDSRNAKMETFEYDDKIVAQFAWATVVFGLVGVLLGLWAALQLANVKFNLGLPWTTFGRVRPLHTNAVIFGFAANAVFAGVYYSTQRLLKARLSCNFLSKFHFWSWQAVIVGAAITLPLGFSQSKEYAELEWPFDILIALSWVAFCVNVIGTMVKRREKHIYVAIWFYIATMVAVTILHVVNSLEVPVSLMQSYPLFAGVQDALVQWWYGHNAVAFVLTTPFLGLMYYYVPKISGRPVFSYKLSILHFWSLVFIYIWAGPHHLLYTALPEWLQTLGMIFSVMLWAPSWGGGINGLLTLKGRFREQLQNPVIKFMVAAIVFYLWSTFEGPLLSIKTVSYYAHYTDGIIAHVHGGGLGWNGGLAFGMLYWLIPTLWRTKLWSQALCKAHFWLFLLGVSIYMAAMYAAAFKQGSMWFATHPDGRLVYPQFIDTVTAIVPHYYLRAVGGSLFVLGFFLFVINLLMTVLKAPKRLENETVTAPALQAESFEETVSQRPHKILEGIPLLFTALTLGVVLIGSTLEILPTFLVNLYSDSSVKVAPYTPLEVAGRDIYVREGCYECHSQMIRPIMADVLRYGPPSKPEESQWDRPFQWGSKRTGPDLARVGGKYSHKWHYEHMRSPQTVVPGSVMPIYPWLETSKADLDSLPTKLKVLKKLGTPYTDKEVESAAWAARNQAEKIASELESQGVAGASKSLSDKEITALIAYLQRLGTSVRSAP